MFALVLRERRSNAPADVVKGSLALAEVPGRKDAIYY
jgi:hypothetical protein